MTTPQDDSDILRRRIEILELENKKQALEQATKPPAAKRWWQSAVELIAVPAAVIGLAVQITTVSGNIYTQQKTQREIEQLGASAARAPDASKLAEALQEK
jgi:hypothetical protein